MVNLFLKIDLEYISKIKLVLGSYVYHVTEPVID